MSVHHALRTACRPGGVVDGDHLLLVLQDAFDRLRRALHQVVLVSVAWLPAIVYTHGLDALHTLEQLLKLGVHEDHLGLRVLDDVLDLTRAQPGVYGDENQTRCGYGESSLEHRRGVWGQKSHPVTLVQTRLMQARGG